jgi:hypothetical protein
MAITGGNRQVAAGLAGRRIDTPGASPPRFPLERVGAVRSAIFAVLQSEQVGLLVCSAACGADLIALQAAASLGIRRRIILPYNVADFRASSVVDRPGDWGPVFDETISSVGSTGDLVVLNGRPADAGSYAQANKAIVQDVLHAGLTPTPIAILVWEGTRRANDDATANFCSLARQAGLAERTVLTWEV